MLQGAELSLDSRDDYSMAIFSRCIETIIWLGVACDTVITCSVDQPLLPHSFTPPVFHVARVESLSACGLLGTLLSVPFPFQPLTSCASCTVLVPVSLLSARTSHMSSRAVCSGAPFSSVRPFTAHPHRHYNICLGGNFKRSQIGILGLQRTILYKTNVPECSELGSCKDGAASSLTGDCCECSSIIFHDLAMVWRPMHGLVCNDSSTCYTSIVHTAYSTEVLLIHHQMPKELSLIATYPELRHFAV